MTRQDVETISHAADRQREFLGIRLPVTDERDDEPWTAPPSRGRQDSAMVGPFPEQIELVFGNQI